ELALDLGRALGARLGPGARVLVGRDTRLSGPMLEAALAAGISAAGARVDLLGVLPTPAVAELVLAEGAAAGPVISASHNPFDDTGIKLFGPDGFKLAEADEAAIESAIGGSGLPERPVGAAVGAIDAWPEGRERYVETLLARFPLDLSDLRIVLDCAHGATAATAPDVLRALGAQVATIGAAPDGVNINDGVGSTHLAALQEAVPAGGHDLGLAFDGDGDPVLA